MTTLRAMSATLALRRQVLRAVGRPVLTVLLAAVGIASLVGALQCTPVAAQDTAVVTHEIEPPVPVLVVEPDGDGRAAFNGDRLVGRTVFVLTPGASIQLPNDGAPYPTVRIGDDEVVYAGRFRLLIQLPDGDVQELTVHNGTVARYPSHAAARRAGVLRQK